MSPLQGFSILFDSLSIIISPLRGEGNNLTNHVKHINPINYSLDNHSSNLMTTKWPPNDYRMTTMWLWMTILVGETEWPLNDIIILLSIQSHKNEFPLIDNKFLFKSLKSYVGVPKVLPYITIT